MLDDIPIQNTARDKAWAAFIKRKHVKEMFPQEFEFPLDRGYYELWCQCWSKAWNAGFVDGYNAGKMTGKTMAATPEVKVKKQIRKLLDEAGAYYAMPIGTGYGNSGVPDFLLCHKGRFIAVEAKAGSNKPTALQEMHLAKIRAAGGVALVINEDNMDTLRKELS